MVGPAVSDYFIDHKIAIVFEVGVVGRGSAVRGILGDCRFGCCFCRARRFRAGVREVVVQGSRGYGCVGAALARRPPPLPWFERLVGLLTTRFGLQLRLWLG